MDKHKDDFALSILHALYVILGFTLISGHIPHVLQYTEPILNSLEDQSDG